KLRAPREQVQGARPQPERVLRSRPRRGPLRRDQPGGVDQAALSAARGPILAIEHLTKVYGGGTRALSDVSFEVARGEFLIIIGLSGSGKSTLLRCINRLIEPTSGRVVFAGRDVTAAPPQELREIRRKLGMIFQPFTPVRRASVLTQQLTGRPGHLTPPWPRD